MKNVVKRRRRTKAHGILEGWAHRKKQARCMKTMRVTALLSARPVQTIADICAATRTSSRWKKEFFGHAFRKMRCRTRPAQVNALARDWMWPRLEIGAFPQYACILKELQKAGGIRVMSVRLALQYEDPVNSPRRGVHGQPNPIFERTV